MQGGQLDEREFGLRVQELGKEWKAMNEDDQQPYHTIAQCDNNMRDELLKEPLPAAFFTDPSRHGYRSTAQHQRDVELCGQKFCKKASIHRLEHNFRNYANHDWSSYDVGISCSQSFLHPRLVNHEKSDEDIKKFFKVWSGRNW
jgi:hypothetical protein